MNPEDQDNSNNITSEGGTSRIRTQSECSITSDDGNHTTSSGKR